MASAYVIKPLTPVRRIIASRMAEAARTIPHFRTTIDIGADALIEHRKRLLQSNSEARLSFNDFLIKACATALMEVPAVNSQWAEGEIHQYTSADISIVAALEGGLSTPIIRAAETKTVREISTELRSLIERAARNALRMDEVFGGSFSLSNLGMFGVDQFDAVINAPQCAILAIGAARPRAVVAASGAMRSATLFRATVSADHRAIDGTTVAAFLNAFRQTVENPAHIDGGGGS